MHATWSAFSQSGAPRCSVPPASSRAGLALPSAQGAPERALDPGATTAVQRAADALPARARRTLALVVLMRPWRSTSVVSERSSALRWSAGRPRRLSLLRWRIMVTRPPLDTAPRSSGAARSARRAPADIAWMGGGDEQAVRATRDGAARRVRTHGARACK